MPAFTFIQDYRSEMVLEIKIIALVPLQYTHRPFCIYIPMALLSLVYIPATLGHITHGTFVNLDPGAPFVSLMEC